MSNQNKFDFESFTTAGPTVCKNLTNFERELFTLTIYFIWHWHWFKRHKWIKWIWNYVLLSIFEFFITDSNFPYIFQQAKNKIDLIQCDSFRGILILMPSSFAQFSFKGTDIIAILSGWLIEKIDVDQHNQCCQLDNIHLKVKVD